MTVSDEYTKESSQKIMSDICTYVQPVKSSLMYTDPAENVVLVTTTFARASFAARTRIFEQSSATVSLTTKKVVCTDTSVVLPPIVEAWSKDRSLCARLFCHIGIHKPAYHVEIRSPKRLLYEISLSDHALHEKVYDEEKFSSMVWSDASDKLYYTAETHKPSKDSFVHEEHFGEHHATVFLPGIFCIDMTSKTVSKAVDLPKYIHPCKLFYKEKNLYFLAYEFPKGKRGLGFPSQQKSLFVVKSGGDIEKLTPTGRTVVSCTFNPDFPIVFIQERNTGGSGVLPIDLVAMKLGDIERTVVMQYIWPAEFQEHCWLNEKDCPGIVVNLITGMDPSMKLIVFRYISDHWQLVPLNTMPDYDYKLLTTSVLLAEKSTHICVCSKSNFQTPWGVVILKIVSLGDTQKNDALIEEINVFIQEQIVTRPYSHKLIYFDDDRQIVEKEQCMFTGKLWTPDNFKPDKSTIIVVPRAGPHHLRSLEYTAWCDYFLQDGFAIYTVDFNRCTGFDPKSHKSFLGENGKQDSDDVHFSLLSVCKKENITSKNIVCLGICYEGFLCAHLLGQFPETYSAGLLFSPLINLLDLVGCSDVPENVITLAGEPEPSSLLLDDSQLSKLYKLSPIIHANKIKSPVRIFLAEGDERVPIYQGLQLYRLLRSKNHDVKVHMYKGGHELDDVEARLSMGMEISSFLRKISA